MMLPLFPDNIEQHPTPAQRSGTAVVRQCSYCGLLAAVQTTSKLGPCPACNATTWTTQPVAVGPFRPTGHPILKRFEQ